VEALIVTGVVRLRSGSSLSGLAIPAYTVCHVDESDPDVPVPGKAGVGFVLSA
jgi:hypothetical protein